MDANKNSWKMGEVVVFPWKSRPFIDGELMSFHHFYSSTFVCVREEDEKHPGILLKVLSRTSLDDIMIEGGELFCKDERNNSIDSKTYYCFRFPTIKGLKDVLEILRKNPDLMSVLQRESMFFHLDSTFWVREPAHHLIFLRKPQYYDSRSGSLHRASDDSSRRRLSLLYFQKGKLYL